MIMHNMETTFAHNPTNIGISRSSHFLDEKRLMTINSGALIPFYLEEVLPGDTFTVDTSILARMATPIHPVLDSAYIDYYYFFVPNRLVWDHWEEFNGANSKAWYQNVEYTVPQIKTYNYWSEDEQIEYNYAFNPGSIADFFGLPTITPFGPVSALPFRAYALIWNEWFRDQNLQDEIFVPTDDNDRDSGLFYLGLDDPFLKSKVTKINESNNCIVGGAPAPVAKLPDYFTTALPMPQKGPNVPLPIEGTANVYGRDNAQLLFNGVGDFQIPVTQNGSTSQMDISKLVSGLNTGANGTNLSQTYVTGTLVDINGSSSTSGVTTSADDQIYPVNIASKSTLSRLGSSIVNPIYADIQASIGTINDLRLAFAIQRLYERDARGGTRYRELILSHFNVRTGDARVQIPEFLAGKRVRVGMTQVIQTSASDGTSPQGNTAAYSLTTNTSSDFTKSFTEHGMVIGVCCIRQHQSYQQGVHSYWNKRDRFDFYWPALANIGNLPILNREIYAGSFTLSGDENNVVDLSTFWDQYESSENVGIFGYKEAWSEYRWKPDVVTGAFRSNYPDGSLDVWHYSNAFELTPRLSSAFIQESPVNIQRTLAVQDEPQFLVDVTVKNKAVRPIPLYSIPGLIDHN